jgi:signal transduction histidine kinase
VETGWLRVHDPFELIRWLAISQPDPRKALAELVQNSLDASARSIRVVRRREKGRLCLQIWDDGEGVTSPPTSVTAASAR